MAQDAKLQLNLFNALKTLVYTSFVSGVLPYSLSAYRNFKQFRVSLWSIALMVISTVHIVLQYHFAAREFSWRDSTGSSGALTRIIGLCILYLVPTMLVIDVIGCIINRKVLIDSLDRFQNIDDKLLKQNITINYGALQRRSIILLALITFFEYALVFYDCFLFGVINFKSFWWLITIFPMWSSTISKIWFIILVFNIQQKFDAINGHLENTKTFIFETKNRLNSARTKSDVARRRFHEAMDYPGYLHKEIFTTKPFRRVGKFQTFDKHGIVQVLPINQDDDTKDFKGSRANSIESFIPFYSEVLSVKDKSFLVDDKLDKKLISLCQIHDDICDAGKTVNRMFSFQMLILMAHGFMSITAQFYFMYCGLVHQSIPQLFRSAESIYFSIGYILYTGAKCVYVILMSWKTKIVAQKTGVYIHKVANVVDEDHCYQIVNHLSLKLLNHKLNFTACGFFDLDMTTLYAITGAITSYLIILIQFNVAAKRTLFTATGNMTENGTTTDVTVQE